MLNDSVFKVITAANFWDTPIDLLVMGNHTEKVANQAAKIKDLNSIIRVDACLLYTSPSPRDATLSRMPSSA